MSERYTECETCGAGYSSAGRWTKELCVKTLQGDEWVTVCDLTVGCEDTFVADHNLVRAEGQDATDGYHYREQEAAK